MMLESAGFEVIDLGVDVPVQTFLDTVSANPDTRIVCCSALLTTTMPALRDTIAALNAAPFRSGIKVMVEAPPSHRNFPTRSAPTPTPKTPHPARREQKN